MVLLALFLHHFQLPTVPTVIPSAEPHASVLEVVVEPPKNGFSLAAGMQRVEMLQLKVTASCNADATIQSLSLRHTGLGNRRDIEGIYVVREQQRLNTPRVMDSNDNTVVLRLRRVSIPACKTATLRVFADFSRTASVGGEHRLVLEALDARNATVRITQPPLKQQHSPRASIVGGATVGRIDIEHLRLLRPIRFGTSRTVARIVLTAKERHQLLYGLRFTLKGTARARDVRNFFLETSAGERVSSIVEGVERDQVYVPLDPPMVLMRNNRRVLELHADILGSAYRSMEFIIEEPGDVVAGTYRGR